jgi:hypothetical protein
MKRYNLRRGDGRISPFPIILTVDNIIEFMHKMISKTNIIIFDNIEETSPPLIYISSDVLSLCRQAQSLKNLKKDPLNYTAFLDGGINNFFIYKTPENKKIIIEREYLMVNGYELPADAEIIKQKVNIKVVMDKSSNG